MEGRQEGRKEKIHSCYPVYLGLLENCCWREGPLPSLPLRSAPGRAHRGPAGSALCRLREGMVCDPSTLTLPPLGVAMWWPQECGGGEQESPGIRIAVAAGNRDVRSPPLRAAPGGQGGKVERKPRSQGSCLFVNLFEGRAEEADVNNREKHGQRSSTEALYTIRQHLLVCWD